MSYRFSQASLTRLATVDERLQRVAKRAIQLTTVDFSVTQGNRTRDEQMRLYGKGRTASACMAKGVPTSYAKPNERIVTWTLNSNHIGGRAIDVAPFVGGKLEWDENGKLGLWPQIANAFKLAACELDIEIEWGGDWTKTVDRPHFELAS